MSTVTSSPGAALSGQPATQLLSKETTEDQAVALLTAGKISPQEFVAWVKSKNGNGAGGWHPTPPRLKVTPKGCIHFGGCHNKQFGLTLYVSTVEYLYSIQAEVEEFIRQNNGRLARK